MRFFNSCILSWSSEQLALYRQAAQAGNASALQKLTQLSATSGRAAFYLAQIYENDWQQFDHALPFYEKAHQLDDGEAIYTLGNIYAQGRANIAVDITRASHYYIMASQQGYVAALLSLKTLATQGYAAAQFSLAEYYRSHQEDQHALRWLVQAALSGYTPAIQTLKNNSNADQHWKIADLYLDYGLTQDDPRWNYHCQKAADKGHPQAAFYLAQASEGSQGRRNHSRILTCYHASAQSHSVEAQAALQRCSNELIYTARNSSTLFSALNSAHAGRLSQTPLPLHAVQQKMQRKYK